MAWSDLRPPLPRRELAWIERSMDLLIDHFGRSVVYRPIVTPVSIVPPGYSNSAEDVQVVFAQICAQLDVPPQRLGLELDYDRNPPRREGDTGQPFTISQWQPRASRNAVNVWMKSMPDAAHLVASLAQEVCKELLEGKSHLAARSGEEPSADLLTVIFGMGIFTANTARDDDSKHRWVLRGADTECMSKRMYGYALALYCWLRDEPDPAWSAHLETPIRRFMKRGIFYLNARMA